ncbi:MAG TPA: pyridoxamine 5'-phosphate oxidase family protein [Caulobacteraceae bacterium]|nr:pyridoxamine 5'-phosphate oxidase family protein [Caulobacteraceae bacterium]
MSLVLGEEIKELVNGALMGGHPMVIGVVGPQGRPRLSFRGSIQAFSDDALGFWARNREGSTVKAIAANPHVALMLRVPSGPVVLQFAGRARLASVEEGEQVFAAAPEVERRADPEKKGVGVIIELDRVEGLLGLDPSGQRRFVRLTRD